MCKREHLNYMRIREWQDYESQLRQVAKEMKLDVGHPSDTPDEDGIHQALLSGLLSHIGALEERDKAKPGERRPMREYLGARNARFAIFPGSVLKGRNPGFLMSAELVETSRLWARQNAAIKPEWAERLGDHLVKRTYSEPHWSRKRAAVMARERVTLYGVPLVADRLVQYGRIDAPLARELFIRHALVQREWDSRHRFLAENARLLEEAEELEHRARRRDIVVDEETLFEFYDARVGADVVSGQHFDQWWKRARQKRPDLLTFDPAMLTHDTAGEVRAHDFPTQWHDSDEAGPDLPDQLSLRARRGRRRPHHRRPGRHPQPHRGRRLLLARARAARGAGDRADPLAAEEPARRDGAGAQHRAGVPRRRPARQPSRCSTRSSASPAAPAAWSSTARRGTGRRCPRTSGRPTA